MTTDNLMRVPPPPFYGKPSGVPAPLLLFVHGLVAYSFSSHTVGALKWLRERLSLISRGGYRDAVQIEIGKRAQLVTGRSLCPVMFYGLRIFSDNTRVFVGGPRCVVPRYGYLRACFVSDGHFVLFQAHADPEEEEKEEI